MTKKEGPNFEQALGKLEESVRKLEAGDLPLDDSLKIFEEGTKLARTCETKLSEAKGKVEKLLRQADGSVITEPLSKE